MGNDAANASTRLRISGMRGSTSSALPGAARRALRPVAVKVLREEIVERASAAELHQFKQEAAMLRGLRHPYVLSFYGARLDRHPYMLVSEVRRAPSW